MHADARTARRSTNVACAPRLVPACRAAQRRGMRHTFASHALQLVRGGYPITTFDGAKLLGHTSSALVEERYGRLVDDVKSRSEGIEYRVEHFVHRPEFHARLTAIYQKAGLNPRSESSPSPPWRWVSDDLEQQPS